MLHHLPLNVFLSIFIQKDISYVYCMSRLTGKGIHVMNHLMVSCRRVMKVTYISNNGLTKLKIPFTASLPETWYHINVLKCCALTSNPKHIIEAIKVK